MTTTLDDRVAEQTRELAELEKLRQMGVRVPDKDAWMKSFGWAKDDPIHEEAMRLGAEWRQEVNRRSIEALDAGS